MLNSFIKFNTHHVFVVYVRVQLTETVFSKYTYCVGQCQGVCINNGLAIHNPCLTKIHYVSGNW